MHIELMRAHLRRLKDAAHHYHKDDPLYDQIVKEVLRALDSSIEDILSDAVLCHDIAERLRPTWCRAALKSFRDQDLDWEKRAHAAKADPGMYYWDAAYWDAALASITALAPWLKNGFEANKVENMTLPPIVEPADERPKVKKSNKSKECVIAEYLRLLADQIENKGISVAHLEVEYKHNDARLNHVRVSWYRNSDKDS